jgi:hypothetical protein
MFRRVSLLTPLQYPRLAYLGDGWFRLPNPAGYESRPVIIPQIIRQVIRTKAALPLSRNRIIDKLGKRQVETSHNLPEFLQSPVSPVAGYVSFPVQ